MVKGIERPANVITARREERFFTTPPRPRHRVRFSPLRFIVEPSGHGGGGRLSRTRNASAEKSRSLRRRRRLVVCHGVVIFLAFYTGAAGMGKDGEKK